MNRAPLFSGRPENRPVCVPVLRALAIIALLMAFCATGTRPLSVAAQSGSVVVTSSADSGAGSLRAAVASVLAGGEITFSLSTPATITLLTPLVVDRDMTITGPG